MLRHLACWEEKPAEGGTHMDLEERAAIEAPHAAVMCVCVLCLHEHHASLCIIV